LCVDNVVEPSDVENMDAGVGILYLAVLCASGLGGRYIYFRYNATSDDIVNNTIDQLYLETWV